MIHKLEVSGQHTEVTPKLQKYISKKIGGLDKYVARKARAAVHAEVKLKEGKSKDKKQYTAEVVMHVPKETITVSETAINMFAAIDIVESKLRTQLKKYKDLHSEGGLHKKLARRIKKRWDETAPAA